jgi:uncharacterized protein
MDDPLYQRLLASLGDLEQTAVAFSGGADSGLLLAAAVQACSGQVVALTAVAPFMVRQEISDAVAFAAGLGIRHELVELPMPEAMTDNPPERCYHCKRALYELLIATAERLGCTSILDGTNLDDMQDYRPGLRAVNELGVRTPLVDCAIGKADVRRLSQGLGLSTWDKATNTCLLTRLPFGTPVSMPMLQRIEEAERALIARGFHAVRVRAHGQLARIEVDAGERERALREGPALVATLKSLGFEYVALDLEGYRLGSMNTPGG